MLRHRLLESQIPTPTHHMDPVQFLRVQRKTIHMHGGNEMKEVQQNSKHKIFLLNVYVLCSEQIIAIDWIIKY